MKRTILIILIAVALMPFVMVAAAESTIEWNNENGLYDADRDCTGYVPNGTDGWLHWVLTGTGDVTEAYIMVDGGEWQGPFKVNNQMIHFYTEPYYTPEELEDMTVTVKYEGTLTETYVFTLSHYCPGDYEVPEFPTLALPIAAIIGIAFLMQRRKE